MGGVIAKQQSLPGNPIYSCKLMKGSRIYTDFYIFYSFPESISSVSFLKRPKFTTLTEKIEETQEKQQT
jgi:hypothetical protein